MQSFDSSKYRKYLVLFISIGIIASGAGVAAKDWREEMLERVNKIREANSAQPLEICESLSQSSQKYARSMARLNFLSHVGKNGSTLTQRSQDAGYVMLKTGSQFSIGENIAGGQSTVREVVLGWKKSQSHFRNMINPKFTHVGFGRAINKNSDLGIYWVQNFGQGGRC